MGDHTETLQIDYDPTGISYEKLLELFWNSHSPESKPWSRQYMSILFCHNEDQAELAQRSKEAEEKRRGKKIYTEIRPAQPFYLAETYHQKYYLQSNRELLREYLSFYPDARDFINSTSAARTNGYIRGEGSLAALQKEIDLLGLSEQGKSRLLDIVRS